MDDHVDLATAMSLLLRYEGHVTATAFNGKQALSMARSFKPRVVILDIDLPDRNGYEVAKVLRLECQADPMSIIAISGRDRDPQMPIGPMSIINLYMQKPIALELLFQALDHITES